MRLNLGSDRAEYLNIVLTTILFVPSNYKNISYNFICQNAFFLFCTTNLINYW